MSRRLSALLMSLLASSAVATQNASLLPTATLVISKHEVLVDGNWYRTPDFLAANPSLAEPLAWILQTGCGLAGDQAETGDHGGACLERIRITIEVPRVGALALSASESLVARARSPGNAADVFGVGNDSNAACPSEPVSLATGSPPAGDQRPRPDCARTVGLPQANPPPQPSGDGSRSATP